MGADEKFNTVLEQYSLEIKQMYKFGGALYLETEQGFFMLRQRNLKEGRAVFEEKIKELILGNGFEKIDTAVKNKEDKYVTEGTYGETYILRHWYRGEECDLTNQEEAFRAVCALGRIHRCMWGLEAMETPYVAKTVSEKFTGRTGEMRRLVSYLRKLKQKNKFETYMEGLLPVYLEQAYRAQEYLNKSYDETLLNDAVVGGGIFHGAFTGHNLIMGEEPAIVNFEKAKLGPKVYDLYHFLRKCGEKNRWNSDFLERLIEGYCSENLLDDREINVLNAQLMYPEKFWKTVNMYYNGKKTWVPGKVEEKLYEVCDLQVNKEDYIKWRCGFDD